jgi:hypothetical protein
MARIKDSLVDAVKAAADSGGEPMVPPRAPSFFAARGGSLLRSGESAVSPPRVEGWCLGRREPLVRFRPFETRSW